MTYTSPGHIHTVEDFREFLQRNASTLDCIEDVQAAGRLLAQDRVVAGRKACNRFCAQPSKTSHANPDGSPSDQTRAIWETCGLSGAGLIWSGSEYAVEENGKANPDQLFHDPERETKSSLRKLIKATQAGIASTGDDPGSRIIGLQLNHAGRFARPHGQTIESRIVHHHPQLAIKYGLSPDAPLLTDDELKDIRDRFVDAATNAQTAGFDFVSINCARGHLLHELLAARTRNGCYGGSLENRLRLLREIIEGIQQNCSGFNIGINLSLTDRPPFQADPDTGEGKQMARGPGDWPYGFGVSERDPDKADLFEPFSVLAMMQVMRVRLVSVSVGAPDYCRHVYAPGSAPSECGYHPSVHPLDGVRRHIEATRACKQRYPDLNIVGNGYSWLQQYLPNVAAMEIEDHHVDFIGLGRILHAYPTMPRDLIQHGVIDGTWLKDLFKQ
ncbi:MAG: hypothetical protein P8M22_06330 [Phycisphaerales bacterium]|nr:hypothetical protein [Phycisphaerales bacterium]